MKTRLFIRPSYSYLTCGVFEIMPFNNFMLDLRSHTVPLLWDLCHNLDPQTPGQNRIKLSKTSLALIFHLTKDVLQPNNAARVSNTHLYVGTKYFAPSRRPRARQTQGQARCRLPIRPSPRGFKFQEALPTNSSYVMF